MGDNKDDTSVFADDDNIYTYKYASTCCADTCGFLLHRPLTLRQPWRRLCPSAPATRPDRAPVSGWSDVVHDVGAVRTPIVCRRWELSWRRWISVVADSTVCQRLRHCRCICRTGCLIYCTKKRKLCRIICFHLLLYYNV